MAKSKTQSSKKPTKPRKERAPAKAAEPIEAAKPKGGTRGKYRPEFCKRVIELGKQGKSRSQMAAALNVARSTFDSWMEAHEELSEAYLLADTHARSYWEDLAERGVMLGARLNDRALLAMLRARWSDFKDERSLELSGAVGGDPVRLVVSQLESGL